MAQIELNKISKFFPNGTQALNNINFTIEDGEFFILVGPSGCGKSTLLNMIVGLEEISSGEIRVDGKIVNELDPKDRNMAMVFQSYALYPHMTVRQNMAFPLSMAKLPKQEIEQRVEQAAEILELSDLLARKPRNLSGGQRQRVAMGRAIVRQPVAFLLDEPLSNLDARLRVQMRTELARLQKRLNTTTIYVTHDQTEAMTLGDRVAVMKDGLVQQVDTPYELYEKPHNLFVAGFIGSPAMNFFPAQIKAGNLYFPGLDISTPIPENTQIDKKTQFLIAGLRPEHFALEAEDGNKTETQLCRFTINIDVIEWLGADTLIYFQQQIDTPNIHSEFLQLGKDNTLNLVARLNAAHKMKESEQLQLSFDPEHLHLFNPATGTRLT